jgi:hypothetical protein
MTDLSPAGLPLPGFCVIIDMIISFYQNIPKKAGMQHG